jgi:hypothetical protein
VDELRQWQIMGAVEQISHAFLLPMLAAAAALGLDHPEK